MIPLHSSERNGASDESQNESSDPDEPDDPDELPPSSQRPVSSGKTAPRCSSACCRGEAPCQPRDRAAMAKTARTQSGRTRYFNPEWYEAHPWLTLCTSAGKAFCNVCRSQKGRLNFRKNQDPAFITKGFNNWKDANKKFHTHETSKTHREACVKALAFSRSKSVDTMISQQRDNEISKRRLCLQKEVETLIFLMKQNLAIRGKDEADGNLRQLLKLRSNDVHELKSHEKYLSPVIQNELIKDIGLSVLRKILVEVREARFFAIMLDETSDSSLNPRPAGPLDFPPPAGGGGV